MSPEIISIALFFVIALVAAAVFMLVRDLVTAGRGPVHQRLSAGVQQAAPLPGLAPDPTRLQSDGGTFSQWLQTLQLEAGITGRDTGAAFWLITLGSVLVGGLLMVWFDNVIAAATGAAIGALGVLAVLVYQRSERRKKIRDQLPLAIDLLVRAVRAGESFDQAVSLVGQSLAEPLGSEFRRCARQLEMGLSVGVTMHGLVRRVPLLETRIFASTVIMQRQSGGNLPLTLERIAEVVRERLDYQRQFRSVTATSRFSTILIALAVPGLLAYLFFAQREYINPLLTTQQGQILLAVAAGLLVVGLFWIFSLLKTDY